MLWKTTASQHLTRVFGYLHVEASDFMHLSYYYRHGYRGLTTIGDFAESALVQKPTIAAEKIVEYLINNLDAAIVVSGFRAPEEVKFFEVEMAVFGKRFSSWFVIAEENARFERMQARARPGDSLTIGQFRARDLQQARMGLEKIKEMAEVSIIENNGSLESYLGYIDRIVVEERTDEITSITASLPSQSFRTSACKTLF